MKKTITILLALALAVVMQAQMVSGTAQNNGSNQSSKSVRLHSDSYKPGWRMDFSVGINTGIGFGYRFGRVFYAGIGVDVNPISLALPLYANIRVYLPLTNIAFFWDGEVGYAVNVDGYGSTSYYYDHTFYEGIYGGTGIGINCWKGLSVVFGVNFFGGTEVYKYSYQDSYYNSYTHKWNYTTRYGYSTRDALGVTPMVKLSYALPIGKR